MNPALSHWYPPPPSQDDEDEFYDPFENGADTWNWEIHMCLIFNDVFMIALELKIYLSLWAFTKRDENANVVQVTQLVFARLLLMNELRQLLKQKSSWFQWVFIFASTWEDHLFQVGWTPNLVLASVERRCKIRRWAQTKILRWHDDELKKRMFF